uniref:RNA helicase n=1 Tax=Hydatigena taeniaeformis TaxID=6205 RepID=A0A0R3WN55_HYDTA
LKRVAPRVIFIESQQCVVAMSLGTVSSFEELGLDDQVLFSVKRLGWKIPTEIQAASIPHALKGRNLIALAETGSGKTGAYTLPILQELMLSPKHYFALILAPTRELAAQVQAQCVALGHSIGLNTALLVGGSPITDQANLMAVKPPHILIATPGRFVDHLKRTKGFDEVKFKNLRFLVIDEADRMLGSDFESVIEKILIVLPPSRQTFLFSATMTEKASSTLHHCSFCLTSFYCDWTSAFHIASLRDPVRISTRKSKFQTVESLRQYVLLVPQAELESYLVYLVRTAFSPLPSPINGLEAIKLATDEIGIASAESRTESVGSAIIFTRTRETSNKLSLLLRQFLTTPVITLNGDMPQAQRLGAIGKFKRLPTSCLVATDVAARLVPFCLIGYLYF